MTSGTVAELERVMSWSGAAADRQMACVRWDCFRTEYTDTLIRGRIGGGRVVLRDAGVLHEVTGR